MALSREELMGQQLSRGQLSFACKSEVQRGEYRTRPRVRILRQTRAGAVDPQQHKTDSGIKNNKSLHLHLILRRCSEFRKPLRLHFLKKSSLSFLMGGV